MSCVWLDVSITILPIGIVRLGRQRVHHSRGRETREKAYEPRVECKIILMPWLVEASQQVQQVVVEANSKATQMAIIQDLL